ncbi:MAG: hypothetical protein PW788_09755 [Micavibrio sp.]|nr:hypothetical protein [Micavibrio sp.]
MADEPKKKPSGYKALVAAGVLTAAAAGAFVVYPHLKSAPDASATKTTQTVPANDPNAIVVSGDKYAASTKDGKMVEVYLAIKPLDKGVFTDQQFDKALKGAATLVVIREFLNHDSKDIPRDIAKIQDDLANGISAYVPVAASGAQMTYAKPGVNFTLGVSKINTAGQPNDVIYQAKGNSAFLKKLGL